VRVGRTFELFAQIGVGVELDDALELAEQTDICRDGDVRFGSIPLKNSVESAS